MGPTGPQQQQRSSAVVQPTGWPATRYDCTSHWPVHCQSRAAGLPAQTTPTPGLREAPTQTRARRGDGRQTHSHTHTLSRTRLAAPFVLYLRYGPLGPQPGGPPPTTGHPPGQARGAPTASALRVVLLALALVLVLVRVRVLGACARSGSGAASPLRLLLLPLPGTYLALPTAAGGPPLGGELHAAACIGCASLPLLLGSARTGPVLCTPG